MKKFFVIISSLLCSFTALADSAKSAELPRYHFVASSFIGIVEQDEERLKGLGVDLVNIISAELGFKVDLQLVPWQRALHMMKLGLADGIVGAYPSEERKSYMDYGHVPIYEDQMLLMSLKQNKFNWTGNTTSLNGFSMALVRHGAYGEQLDSVKDQLDVAILSNTSQMVDFLARKRVDVIACNVRTIPTLLKKYELNGKVKFHRPPLDLRPGYFAKSKLSNASFTIDDFNRVMRRLEAEGTLLALQKMHLPQIYSHTALAKNILLQ